MAKHMQAKQQSSQSIVDSIVYYFITLYWKGWKMENEYYTKTIKTITLKVKEPEACHGIASGSRQCFNIAKEIYKSLDDDQEHFTAFFMNSQNEIKGYKTLFTGGQTTANVDAKVVFRNALLFGATAMIVVHNHPSGTTTPSSEDKQITEELVNAGKILKIKVLDHLIITNNDYFSFADEGLIKRYNFNH
jgi:DNA repair protein RadC